MFFLASRGYRCVAPDRRGHGRSSQPWDGNDLSAGSFRARSRIPAVGISSITTGSTETPDAAAGSIKRSSSSNDLSRRGGSGGSVMIGPLKYRIGAAAWRTVTRESYHRARTIAWSRALRENSEKSVGTRMCRISIMNVRRLRRVVRGPGLWRAAPSARRPPEHGRTRPRGRRLVSGTPRSEERSTAMKAFRHRETRHARQHNSGLCLRIRIFRL
jgi:pimeloyl-ACP methyl ester carboxylesterase